MKKEQMGWPRALASMVSDICCLLLILGIVYLIASCTAGHSLI